ncbi:hypothetical protein LTR94_036559, partial [Friedmanniomyces endolithicus]
LCRAGRGTCPYPARPFRSGAESCRRRPDRIAAPAPDRRYRRACVAGTGARPRPGRDERFGGQGL